MIDLPITPDPMQASIESAGAREFGLQLEQDRRDYAWEKEDPKDRSPFPPSAQPTFAAPSGHARPASPSPHTGRADGEARTDIIPPAQSLTVRPVAAGRGDSAPKDKD